METAGDGLPSTTVKNTVGGDRYELGEPLGSGGTARVYRGYDTHLRVPRAVKLLRGDRTFRDELRPRLHAEARVMASLRHPNVLAVYDFGAEPECDWVVMELAEGGSLDDRLLREGRLSPADAVDYGLQILSGLAAAHAANVIHRDIKPQNVLLDRRGVAHLADFGIALFSHESADRLTQTGVSMGSFAYMPPEQRLDARSVGTQADIYAVGATLYVLLTGRTPVDLFAADPRSSRWGAIPEAIAQVLRQATRFEPGERFASALDMAEALADAASRENLLDRAHATGTYAIFSATTMPRVAELTQPMAMDAAPPPPGAGPRTGGAPPLPTAEPDVGRSAKNLTPTHVIPALQEGAVEALPAPPPARAGPVRRRFQWLSRGAFVLPMFAFVVLVAWSASRRAPAPGSAPAAPQAITAPAPTAPDNTPAKSPPASGQAAASTTSPSPAASTQRASPPPTSGPSTPPPASTPTAPEKPTTKAAPAGNDHFRHTELAGDWAANWGEAIARFHIGEDGAVSAKLSAGFGSDRAQPLSGQFRWDGDHLRLEDTRYHGRFVTVVFDSLSADRISGHLADAPGETVTLHRDR